MRVSLVLVVTAAFLLMGAAPPPAASVVTYRLSPQVSDGAVTALGVSVSYAADPTGDGSFEWARSWAGEDRLWQWVRDFKVEGASQVEDLGQGRWRIQAPPGAPLKVSYRVVSAFDHDPAVDDDPGQAAPIIRPSWFYATGEALFGMPKGRDLAPAMFAWSGAPKGFAFASDLQHLADPDRPGHASPRAGTVADVQESISLGGTDLHVAGDAGSGSRVRIASRGRFRFPPEAFDALAQRLIGVERAFWGDAAPAPFLVTLGPLAASPPHLSYSGTGRTDAFAIWYDEAAPLDSVTALLAHEYFHTWNARQLGGLDPDEAREARGYWFSEGFTDYYARRMTLAAGVWTLQDFADAWNEVLKSYDLSAQSRTPNSALAGKFWKDPALHQLPYWRGAVIAAVIDRRLRTRDPQGLDRVLRAQRAAARSPHPEIDAAALFQTTIRRTQPQLDAWLTEAVESGEMVMLPKDAFAPCFDVATAPQPMFDRGFDFAGTHRNHNVVVGVEPDGPAARAGLKNGDKISIDESTVPDPTVARRYVVHEPGGGTHVVEYLPQGREVPVQRLVVAKPRDEAAAARCRELFGRRSQVR
jgi:predicted metalloprotease with PDZ domain